MIEAGLLLSRLNSEGIAVFERFILSHGGASDPLPFPTELLSGAAYSKPVSPTVVISDRRFASRLELAKYLYSAFETAHFRAERGDSGLWTWLACAFYMNFLRDSKDRKPGAVARWVYKASDFQRYYRHLVAGPFFAYQAHRENPERALAILCQPPGKPGDIVEQLASRQEYVTNPAVMAAATRALVDPGKPAKPKRGAGGKSAGSARRFVTVIEQFRQTWDVTTLSPDDLRTLLPAEFGGLSGAAHSSAEMRNE